MSQNEIQRPTDLRNQPDNLKTYVTKESKPRLRHSNLMITINTNDCVVNPSTEEGQQKIQNFRQIIKSIFNESFVQNYFIFKSDAPQGSAFTNLWFPRQPEIHYALEIGGERGFLHCHIGIFIAHRTKIQLDESKFYNDLLEKMTAVGWSNFYINKRWSYNASDLKQGLLEYIKKNPL